MKKVIISVIIIIVVLVGCVLLSDNAKLDETCFNCGERIVKDSSYCEHCGEYLNDTIEEKPNSDDAVESSTESTTVEDVKIEKTTVENTTKNKTESNKPTTTKKAENNDTTTTKPPQVAPNTDDIERKYFQQLYANERERYILNISREINSLESEVSQLKSEASSAYGQYQKDKERTKERFADMGMLNSGAYQAEIKRLDDNYKTTSATYTKRITELENQIAVLEKEKQNPTVENVLKQLATNNNMTYDEAVRKYNKYIAN